MIDNRKSKFCLLLGLIVLVACSNHRKLHEQPITIEATFMQYACGDWNDDMRVDSISDSTFNYLLGKDIDPEMCEGEKVLVHWLFANRTNEFGYSYRLTGHLSKSLQSGCDNHCPKFRIEHIEKLNGESFRMTGKKDK